MTREFIFLTIVGILTLKQWKGKVPIYCNDNEDNRAWVLFVLYGDKYKWGLKVDNDWADGMYCVYC
jgi:hypothetical protein